MDIFSKAVSMALIAVVLCLFVSKRDKEIAMLLSIAACCMLLIVAVQYLKPVFEFFNQLKTLGNFDGGMLSILMQAVGVGVLAQIMSMVCADAGFGAIGKALQILATAVTMCLSLPVFQSLIDLLEGILNGI